MPKSKKSGSGSDLAKAAKNSAYKNAVADLAKLCGSSPRAMKGVKGGFQFKLSASNRKSFKLEKVQADFLKRGCYVFHPDAIEKNSIAILPTADRYDVLLAMETAGPNWNLDTKKIIAWLRKLEKTRPLVITGASCEHVSGRFTTKVKNVEELALRIIDFSPDLDNFGELMTQLPKTGKFSLWWT